MDLIIAKIDTNKIRLVSTWFSNAILNYLHKSTHTFTSGLVDHMVHYGDYAIIPPAHWYWQPSTKTLGVS